MAKPLPSFLKKYSPTKQNAPSTTTTPTHTSINQPRYTSPVPIGSKSNSIAQMQAAIIHLSNVMSKNYTSSMDPKSQPNGGADPFGRFLVNQYMSNQDIVGKQYVNIDTHENARSQTAMPNETLSGIVSTFGHVGTPGVNKGERSPDGIWQTRTDNGLKQVVALAASLLQLSKDMGAKIQNFSDDDVDKLKSFIPKNYVELNGTGPQRAEEITPLIIKIISFYENFEKNILNNDKFKSLISQEKPFNAPNKVDNLDTDEGKFLEKNMNVNIPNANFNGNAITLSNISSLTNFKQFLKDNNLDANNINIFNQNLKIVKDAIENGYDNRRGF